MMWAHIIVALDCLLPRPCFYTNLHIGRYRATGSAMPGFASRSLGCPNMRRRAALAKTAACACRRSQVKGGMHPCPVQVRARHTHTHTHTCVCVCVCVCVDRMQARDPHVGASSVSYVWLRAHRPRGGVYAWTLMGLGHAGVVAANRCMRSFSVCARDCVLRARNTRCMHALDRARNSREPSLCTTA